MASRQGNEARPDETEEGQRMGEGRGQESREGEREGRRPVLYQPGANRGPRRAPLLAGVEKPQDKAQNDPER